MLYENKKKRNCQCFIRQTQETNTQHNALLNAGKVTVIQLSTHKR